MIRNPLLRPSLVLILALVGLQTAAFAQVTTSTIVRYASSGTLVFEPTANDFHPEGVPFELQSAVLGAGCPGTLAVDTALGTLTWSSTETLNATCEITYTVIDERGASADGYILLQPRGGGGGDGPPSGVLTALDERRADFLDLYLQTVLDRYPATSWVQDPAGCPGSTGLYALDPASDARDQRDHWSVILALLGGDDLSVPVLDGGLLQSFDNVELARRMIRYLHCTYPETPILGMRNTAMRVYQLYYDTLFDPLAPGDVDIEAYLAGVVTEAATRVVCTYSMTAPICAEAGVNCGLGTENHCAIYNSFRALSAQIAGLPASDPMVAARKAELITFLRHSVESGFQEWGSGYQEWTWVSLLNLAEFHDDDTVRHYARMALDYTLAVLSTQSDPSGGFASGAARVYPWHLWENPLSQTLTAQILFSGADLEPQSISESAVDFAVSNYRPLEVVGALFTSRASTFGATRTRQRGYIRQRDKTFFHENYHGPTYDLAANVRHQATYGDGDIQVAYLKSMKANNSHVVALWFRPDMADVEDRGAVSALSHRALLWDNVVLYREGGCPRAGTTETCSAPYEPPRIYATPDYAVEKITAGGRDWVFGTNEASASDPDATYFAWSCRYGTLAFESSLVSGPQGSFWRSLFTRTDKPYLGEECVLEAGSPQEFGSSANFRSQVLGRCTGGGGCLQGTKYATGDFAYGSGELSTPVELDLEAFEARGASTTLSLIPDEDEWPRVDSPSFSFDAAAGVFHLAAGGLATEFLLESGALRGDTERLETGWAFGGDLEIDPGTPQLLARKTDLDLDGDGVVQAGDRLRYVIEIENVGDGPATQVDFADVLDPKTTLVAGSASSTHGSVTTTSSRVDVALGTLAPGVTATIQFDADIADPLGAGATSVSNQGEVSSQEVATVLTDDPATPAAGDPTVTLLDAESCGFTLAADALPPSYRIECSPVSVPFSVLTANDQLPADPSTPELVEGSESGVTVTTTASGFDVRRADPYQPVGTFRYRVRDASGGCVAEATVSIPIEDLGDPPNAAFTVEGCEGHDCVFDATASSGGGPLTYHWQIYDATGGPPLAAQQDPVLNYQMNLVGLQEGDPISVHLRVHDGCQDSGKAIESAAVLIADDEQNIGVSKPETRIAVRTLLEGDYGVPLITNPADPNAGQPDPAALVSVTQPPAGRGSVAIEIVGGEKYVTFTPPATYSQCPAGAGGYQTSSFGYRVERTDGINAGDNGQVYVDLEPPAVLTPALGVTCDGLTCQVVNSTPGLRVGHGQTWNFGDGTPAQAGGVEESHTFPAAGTYSITLTLTDECSQTSSTTVSVTVTNPPPPPPTGLGDLFFFLWD